MYKNRYQGFTLIELLVVIAIIGILSAVVLASLNTARSKGNDAAIQSDIAAVQTQAEIFYSNTSNTYGTAAVSACVTAYGVAGSMWADPIIQKAIKAAVVANGGTDGNCGSSSTAYAVKVQLATSPAAYWCVDSAGTANKVTGALAAASTVCP